MLLNSPTRRSKRSSQYDEIQECSTKIDEIQKVLEYYHPNYDYEEIEKELAKKKRRQEVAYELMTWVESAPKEQKERAKKYAKNYLAKWNKTYEKHQEEGIIGSLRLKLPDFKDEKTWPKIFSK